jgi:hypothetical protein
MPQLTLQYWAKTAEGAAMLESQRRFCLGGKLYQGFKGRVAECDERQLYNHEIQATVDVDGSIHEVWRARQSRLESRADRKRREYDERRAILRERRNEIMESIERMEKHGIDASADDLREIEGINQRMERLVAVGAEEAEEARREADTPSTAAPRVAAAPAGDLEGQVAMLSAQVTALLARLDGKVEQADDALAPAPTDYSCRYCDKQPPADHRRPEKWQVGHENHHKRRGDQLKAVSVPDPPAIPVPKPAPPPPAVPVGTGLVAKEDTVDGLVRDSTPAAATFDPAQGIPK